MYDIYYDKWLQKNQSRLRAEFEEVRVDELQIEWAESGADRELDFNPEMLEEEEFEKFLNQRYERYVNGVKEWVKINNTTDSYILNGEPEIIYIIKSGFKGMYIVVHEFGTYMQPTTSLMNKQDIEKEFKIKIQF